MYNKKCRTFGLIVIVILVACFIGWVLPGFSDDAVIVKEDSTITYPEKITFDSKKKPMKIFDHKGHIKYLKNDCVECHHTNTVNNIAVYTCVDCHNIDNPDVGEKYNTSKKTFHGNCVTCHKTIAKEDGRKVKWRDCHKKKKRAKLEGC